MASKFKRKSSGIGMVVIYVLLILAIVACIGFIFRYTNGFSSDFSTFYVSVEGKDVMSSSGGYNMNLRTPLKVDVCYAFSRDDVEQNGYSVKVVPHKVGNNDFDFTLDGMAYAFSEEEDLTKGFDIDIGKTSFSIKPKGNLTQILQSVYPEMTVGDCDDKAYADMFTLIVTSYNGKSSVYLHFTVRTVAEKIELNQTEIIL